MLICFEDFIQFQTKAATLQRTTRDIQIGIFGDNGHSFWPIFTKIGTPCAFMLLRMMLKGFFANINMKAKNKMKGSQVVVELFTLFLGFMLMLAKNPFNIIHKSLNAHGVPNLVRIGQKL